MLQQKAMLVNLNISQWTASKKDKAVSLAVQQQHKANEKKAGWFNKRLIDPTALEPISKIEGRIREFHYKLTLPWGDNGDRILPAKVYMDYVDGLRKFRTEFDDAVDTFVNKYPLLVQEARVMLGTMYDPGDYPDISNIRGRFDLKTTFAPVPDAEDFRVNVGADEIEEIKKSITAGVADRQRAAIKECWGRVRDVVERIQERLATPDAIFRDSLIENAKSLMELLPKLNITEDPELEAVRKDVMDHLIIEPEDLRRYPKTRRQAADKAQEILDKMNGWAGLKTAA